MSTGCLRKSRVVSRDWSRSPLTCPPECSMILCGSMSSRSTKEAVLGGPENMVCARRGLRSGTELGAGVAGLGEASLPGKRLTLIAFLRCRSLAKVARESRGG